MSVIQSANLALRFMLELCALAALGYWGWRTADRPVLKVAVGLSLPVVVAVLWGIFVAPNAAVPLPGVLTFMVALVILELAAASLVAAGHLVLGIAFGVLVLVNAALMAIWRQ